jgi:hypothetical protein
MKFEPRTVYFQHIFIIEKREVQLSLDLFILYQLEVKIVCVCVCVCKCVCVYSADFQIFLQNLRRETRIRLLFESSDSIILV